MENKFTKECPECGCEMCYTRKDTLKESIDKNRLCKSCSKKGKQPAFYVDGEIPKSIREKISKTWFKEGDRPYNADFRNGKTLEEIYGNERAIDIKEKLSNYERTEESNIKRRNSCIEAGCGLYNKGRIVSIETRELISKFVKERVRTDEHNTKIRISNINYINKMLALNGDKMVPRFNINACSIFDEISKKENIFIQHALNGGELFISELGYWVDGYDEINNTVYEYDEQYHFRLTGKLSEKDIKRQKLITEHLNCKFIRIKWSDVT